MDMLLQRLRELLQEFANWDRAVAYWELQINHDQGNAKAIEADKSSLKSAQWVKDQAQIAIENLVKEVITSAAKV